MEDKKSVEQYPFNRNALASTRLDLQHQLWATSTGFLLHSKIPISDNALIADIGCGTGIWSLSLASQLQQSSRNARIEAFDISLAQTLPKQWSPTNVTFQQLNIFDPLPAHLIGRYDIVHIRLFMLVVEKGDPTPLLRQLLKLLKPGGYLQWQEYDPSTDRLMLADPSTSAPKLEALRDMFRGAAVNAPDMNWVVNMHTKLEREGGELLANERVWTAKEMLGLKQEITFLACREWAANMKSRGQHEIAAKTDALCAEVEEECYKLGRGSVIDSEMVTWVVKKK
ncbi:N-methyltransferase tcpN [Pseudocercospora fuligena]|uniref:N-methyltransferase tcpN n=1 Tax=Pseudocercospora fuligena TaxID=685502 RepID=A0A8H6RBT3_9PEZI|nr:N-methyltransferase tcpN [Pseudocercospora fuligena]